MHQPTISSVVSKKCTVVDCTPSLSLVPQWQSGHRDKDIVFYLVWVFIDAHLYQAFEHVDAQIFPSIIRVLIKVHLVEYSGKILAKRQHYFPMDKFTLRDLRYVHADMLLTECIVSHINQTAITLLASSRGVLSVVLSIVVFVAVVIIITKVILCRLNAVTVREETGRRYAQKQLNTSGRHAVEN